MQVNRNTKISLVWAIAMCSFFGHALAQGSITGRVFDASSGEPLAYCHVFNMRMSDGTITNEDGTFQIQDVLDGDTLRISYVGYNLRNVVVSGLREDPDIFLEPQSITLDELFIYANDDYLYSAVEECAAVMKLQPARQAKAYYYVTTDIDGQPNELLECYYNSEIRGASVRWLKLKNGRAGLPLDGDKFFFNLQTSTAINMLQTVEKQDEFPMTPLHYSGRKMKKTYELQRLPNLSDTNTLHISFSPLKNPEEHFSGEMWIDKDSKQLQKLQLTIDDAGVYPFLSLGSRSRINRISFDIVQTFREDEQGVSLDHIEFSYDLTIQQDFRNRDTIPWNLTSSCLLHFYDLDTTFILPYFEYEPGVDDYRQISFIPYDSLFWENTHGYEFSEDQLRRLNFFEQEGFLLNYESDIKWSGMPGPVGILEKPNIIWSGDQRINFGINRSNNAPPTAEFLADMVEVEVQIFLDANEYDDQWAYNSATVLDVYKSYNYVGESPERNCYANIYFDLCEIQRRKLIHELVSNPQTRSSIHETYQRHATELRHTLDKYNKDVDLGMKLSEMKEWNDLVLAELGIDNIALFELDATDE